MSINLTPKVSCQFGAPIGRGSASGIPAGRFYLQHCPLDRGGYDKGGAYWGIGQRIYMYQDSEGAIYGSLRADNRADAKAKVLALYPTATFFN